MLRNPKGSVSRETRHLKPPENFKLDCCDKCATNFVEHPGDEIDCEQEERRVLFGDPNAPRPRGVLRGRDLIKN
jgi:hypothetical protein